MQQDGAIANGEQSDICEQAEKNCAETAEQSAPVATDVNAPAKNTKRQAFIYLICAAVVFAGIYVPQLFNLLRPLFGRVYYGNLNTVFFMICSAAFWVPFIIVSYLQIKKRAGIDVFRVGKDEVPLKRSLIIYAIAFLTIFIISASLGFELKIVKELGKKVTKVKVITNASSYGYEAIKLILATFIIELVQEAGEILFAGKNKYNKYTPYGGIVVCLLFGFTEVLVAYALKTVTVFTWVNIVFYLLYGIIYLLANKRFTITYFVSLVIFIL